MKRPCCDRYPPWHIPPVVPAGRGHDLNTFWFPMGFLGMKCTQFIFKWRERYNCKYDRST